MSKVRLSTNVVKARSATKMTKSKSKVNFAPKESSMRQIARASHEGHIRSTNDIMRFKSIR